jgi:hypothetical protein
MRSVEVQVQKRGRLAPRDRAVRAEAVVDVRAK